MRQGFSGGPVQGDTKVGDQEDALCRPCTGQRNSDGITQSDDAAELRENTEGGPAYTLNLFEVCTALLVSLFRWH